MTHEDRDHYRYHARLVDVVDGDTFSLDVDLGFRIVNRERVRLIGIDTDEIFFVDHDSDEYEEGIEQKEFVESWFAEAEDSDMTWPLTVSTYKGRGKYGRWLADVERKTDGETLADALLAEFGESIRYE